MWMLLFDHYFFHHITQRWFLKKKNNYTASQLHTNHIWINPIHNFVSKKDLSETVKETIFELIQCGSNDTNIKIYVFSQYKIHVKLCTIYNMRMNHIQHIIDLCSEDPGGSAVDKLIALFKNTEDVSCVYLLHKYNSGLVRYRKNRTRIDTDIINNNNLDNGHGYSNESITNWRDSIKLSKSNDVLVAFAWAHDDEIRNTEMFPEMIGMDVTFGVCKERRDLLLAGGIDGNKKAFTAFRCFIPSKLEQTYTWIINEAMNYLLTPKTLKFNSCLSTDQEFCLNSSIITSISSSHSSFKHSKLRLDCYHFYRKVWNQKVVPFVGDHTMSKLILHKLDKWIMSWFKSTETQQEFDISLIYFKKYLQTTTDIIGLYCNETITNLITKMVNKQKLLFHHHFLDTTNFDFLGDSFIEALNQSIKRGPISVNSKMDISNSGFTQLKATTAKSIKRKLETAKDINTHKLWSNSNTAAFLTKYAEGLMCDIFDRRTQYTNIRISRKVWLVIHINSIKESIEGNWDPSKNHPSLQFTRLRTVTLNSQDFMTCSCEFQSRWLLPCSHISNVLEKSEYFLPELMHIRWWKHFNYLYKNNSTNNKALSQKKITEALDYVRTNHFHSSTGKYKGIPMHNNKFLDDVVNNEHIFESNRSHIYYNEIMAIQKMNTKDGLTLIRGSSMFNKYMEVDNCDKELCFELQDSGLVSDYDQVQNLIRKNDCNLQTMGGGSQVGISLSQHRDEMPSDNESMDGDIDYYKNKSHLSIVEESTNAYNRLYPLFCEVVGNIKNEEQMSESKNVLERLEYSLKAQGHKKRVINPNETTFLGEINGHRCIEKRHKPWNEK